MAAIDNLKTLKIGFIGIGNMGQSLMRALLDSGIVSKDKLFVTSRTERRWKKIAEDYSIHGVATNEEIVDLCDVVILATKPQDLYNVIEPIASSFHSGHTVISIAAGIKIQSLKKLIPNVNNIFRVMPNTATKIRKGILAYAASDLAKAQTPWIEDFLGTMGLVVPVEDGEMMESLVVAASGGIGFVYELMIYWKEWLEERGISPELAKKITVQVFAGAAALADESEQVSLDELQRKVVSAKGVTAAGLESIRELEIERALRISFEKAALRDKELGELLIPSK